MTCNGAVSKETRSYVKKWLLEAIALTNSKGGGYSGDSTI